MKASRWIIIFGFMLLVVNIGQLARIMEIDRNLLERFKRVQTDLASLDQNNSICSLETVKVNW